MRGLVLGAAILVAAAAAGAAHAAPPPAPEAKGWGFSLGPFVPAGGLGDAYDVGGYASLSGYYFPARSRHGVRTALWAAGAPGEDDVDNGYGYGIELDYSARFGAGEGPFHFFAGGGLCGSDYIVVKGSFPGGTQIHVRGSAFSLQAGVAYHWSRMFVQASYIEVLDDDQSYGFVPVTVGFRF